VTTEIRTEHPHIVRTTGAGGEKAVIAGTNTSVWFIMRQLRVGDTPEDIVASLPHLSLAGVYDAISYYHDHRDEIDPIIAEGDRLAAAHDSGSATEGASGA
jgi:uncharacterized protein (DUF433 family)